MTLADEIVQLLEQAKDDIQGRMASEDINASGRTSRSFRVERYNGGARLVMGGTYTAPLETLEVGRPGGNVPGGFRTTKDGTLDVSNTFKAILIRWATEKGVSDFGWAQATMLGRRIAKVGTLRHQQPVDVYTSVVMETAERVRTGATATITKRIHQSLRS